MDIRQRLADNRGQSLIEMALLLPVLLLLVFGSIEIGRVVNVWAIVTQASREGARVGAAQCSRDPACDVQIGSWVDNSLSGLDVSKSRWSSTPSAPPYNSGGTLTVRVEYDIDLVTPLISAFFGGSLVTVSGETAMRLE